MAFGYKKKGKIATFTFDRPEARNALNVETYRELQKAMTDFRDDPELWVGIVTGTGDKAFCAGADIKELLPFRKEHRDRPWAYPATPARGLDIWKPLIAAVNGLALGGGLEIALACDIRIAAENARFGQPEILIGMMAGSGGTQRLPRLIPWCKAAELLLVGKPIDAQEAYRIGLVNRVVPLDQLMPTAGEWAEAICQASPLAVRATKEAMVRGYSLTLEDGLRLEYSLTNYVMGTEDFTEGTTAFVEKRKPEFKVR
ncbi:enoyl-CoA hydratase/isomerase family protein [Chloroflexota bacterium]